MDCHERQNIVVRAFLNIQVSQLDHNPTGNDPSTQSLVLLGLMYQDIGRWFVFEGKNYSVDFLTKILIEFAAGFLSPIFTKVQVFFRTQEFLFNFLFFTQANFKAQLISPAIFTIKKSNFSFLTQGFAFQTQDFPPKLMNFIHKLKNPTSRLVYF